jgi:hypothetical protein
MATIREKSPGVWEVRIFTGRDTRGRPTQISRTVRGGKREAQRLAIDIEGGPGRASAGGRTVGDVLDEWVEFNADMWAPSLGARSTEPRPIDQVRRRAGADAGRTPVGGRRRWSDVHERELTIDSAIEVVSRGDGNVTVRSGVPGLRTLRERLRERLP